MGSEARNSVGEALDRVSRLPYDRAYGMPAAFYTDPQVLEVEQRELFRSEWVCVGRIEELSKPGDFITLTLGGEPVLVTRDEAGALHALSNVCRHRGAVIAQGKGNARFHACPYHS